MRSYRPFLSAIPHRRAGYPRVTHPSATRVTPERAPSSDLHVLRTPPAFVLSQDQTRHPSSLQSDRRTLMRTAHFTFYLQSRVLRLSFLFLLKGHDERDHEAPLPPVGSSTSPWPAHSRLRCFAVSHSSVVQVRSRWYAHPAPAQLRQAQS